MTGLDQTQTKRAVSRRPLVFQCRCAQSQHSGWITTVAALERVDLHNGLKSILVSGASSANTTPAQI